MKPIGPITTEPWFETFCFLNKIKEIDKFNLEKDRLVAIWINFWIVTVQDWSKTILLIQLVQ